MGFPITMDIHERYQAETAVEVADIIQIQAFLCRQTDLLVAANKIVNIKKAQFQPTQNMIHLLNKVFESGNKNVIITERVHYFDPGIWLLIFEIS